MKLGTCQNCLNSDPEIKKVKEFKTFEFNIDAKEFNPNQFKFLKGLDVDDHILDVTN